MFELCSTLVGSGTGIAAAVAGIGVWSLVAQTLAGSVTLTALVLVGGGAPRPRFDRSVAAVAAYALNHTGARGVEYLSRNVHDLIVGRYLGAPGLGQYSTAHRLVLFPALARVQGDDARMASAFLEVAGAVAAVTVPLMLGLWAVADVFVALALGAQWEPVGALVRILAPVGALQSVTVLADSLLLAKGRVDLQVRWNLLHGFCVLGGVLVGLPWGLSGVAIGYAVTVVALTYPWLRLTGGLLGMPVGRVLRQTLARPMIAALAMVAAMTWTRSAFMAGWPAAPVIGALAPLGLATYAAAMLGLGERRLIGLARELVSR
jgi:PST family polysaccharide transporter